MTLEYVIDFPDGVYKCSLSEERILKMGNRVYWLGPDRMFMKPWSETLMKLHWSKGAWILQTMEEK